MYSNDSQVIPAFDGRKFAELFDVLGKWNQDAHHTQLSGGHVVSGWLSFTLTRSYAEKNAIPFIASLKVSVSKEVLTWINSHMLAIKYDRIYFDAVVFDDNSVAIYAKYNQIIGSRLIGWFDLSELMAG